MATMLLQYAGGLAGGMLGGPVGAMLGRALGGIAGSVVDQSLFGGKMEGPRLGNLQVLSSQEGAAIPALWGKARLSGQVIWAAPIVEHKKKQKAGGKGGPSISEYSYTASFAVGICEGPISRIGRIWADGNEIDPARFPFRLYLGTETQKPDSLIASLEGKPPAYRGLAYVVFTDLPLAPFGNRVPQLSFEVFRQAASVAREVKAICIIPGAGEFVYDTKPVSIETGLAKARTENQHASASLSDWSVSMDQLQAACPAVKSAGLVTAWFGTSLAAGNCQVLPGVDNREKRTKPISWSVAGCNRANAHLVSRVHGRAAYGGTPSDSAVRRALLDLQARGLKPVFYPFILMDIPPDNAAGEPAYPWRGTITPSSIADMRAFFGSSKASDFTIEAGEVRYRGTDGWSYSRMVLHYARLCAQVGGVDAFLIGSELKGLTQWRDADGNFPAVAELVRLAQEAKQLLPEVKIGYAADWSEYGGHVPSAAPQDLCFPLDPLWASPAIDFIGIDNYFPLSDWRQEQGHLDALAGAASCLDLDYLKANAAAGEYFDWYYANHADRLAQQRTPITDGAYGKPWVYRAKDIRNWWLNPHHERVNGVEKSAPTDFVPQQKPIWFTEVGCPAVDNGANEPNVFWDAKSSAGKLPAFSKGLRDDDMQRRYLEAVTAYWSQAGANPISVIYGRAMLDMERTHVWCWDARPFPAFPRMEEVWSDGENHARGHWLNGRMDAAPVSDVIEEVLARFGAGVADASQVRGTVDGFLVDRPMSARQALEPLLEAFCVDAVESGDRLHFRMRGQSNVMAISHDMLVETDAEQPLKRMQRAEASMLPAAMRIGFADPVKDYQPAAVEARRRAGAGVKEAAIELSAVMSAADAEARAGMLLQDAWAQRETAEFTLPPSLLALEPGDVVKLEACAGLYRITGLGGAGARRTEAVGVEASLFTAARGVERASAFAPIAVPVAPALAVLDLPLLGADDVAGSVKLAAASDPWAESLALLHRLGPQSYRAISAIRAPATMGVLMDPLKAGPLWRLDRANRFRVTLSAGTLSSVSLEELLAGANRAAIGTTENGFELIQFLNAVLVAQDAYEISGLLRAQAGSEPEMQAVAPQGSLFVLIDDTLVDAGVSTNDIGRLLTWRAGPMSRDMADDSYREIATRHLGRSLRPLRPVHCRMQRGVDGTAFQWSRRTRLGGDSWDLADVPLAEEREAYALAFSSLAGETRYQTTSNAPHFFFPAAEELAHFGKAGFRLAIAQIGAAYGQGPSLEVTVHA
jgi:hypothetical protein